MINDNNSFRTRYHKREINTVKRVPRREKLLWLWSMREIRKGYMEEVALEFGLFSIGSKVEMEGKRRKTLWVKRRT